MNVVLNIFVIIFVIIMFYYFKNDLFFTFKPANIVRPRGVSKKKIAVVTYEDRMDNEYYRIHKYNVKQYCDRNEYSYFKNEFDNQECASKSPYWYKIEQCMRVLQSDQYDYVLWMDSDAVFVNLENRIEKFLDMKFDIFIGVDNYYSLFQNNLCAGVFIIKSSDIGKSFLRECLNTFDCKQCFKKDNKTLNGPWAQGKCYEQGVMSRLIKRKYNDSCLVWNSQIVQNGHSLNKVNPNVEFIYHCAGSPKANLRKFIP